MISLFNLTFSCIDNVFSLKNLIFGDYVERIYPIELEIKYTTDTIKSGSNLDLRLDMDDNGLLNATL